MGRDDPHFFCIGLASSPSLLVPWRLNYWAPTHLHLARSPCHADAKPWPIMDGSGGDSAMGGVDSPYLLGESFSITD